MTSSSSIKSNSSLREMKGVLELKILPKSLSRFKLNLFLFFTILIITAIIMLTVNLMSQDDYVALV